ncbi:MAG: hypothetical protein GF334_04010 [Candidatus Altiarchaeales archaeon]|nr:hypothetical protein [Candidatus Altiarchaeales archaeon]
MMDREDEEKIVEYYKKTLREDAKEGKTLADAYRHIKNHKTQGYTTRLFLVDWEGYFNENKCPVCGKTITLKETQYLCEKCGYTMDADLYERARKQYEEKKVKQEKAAEKERQLHKQGYTQKKLDELYEKAVKETVKEEEDESR